MHTPDGLLTSPICYIMAITSLSFIIYSAYNSRNWLTKEKAIQLSVMGAIIFAFQMLNFPIAKGTSGHLIGGAMVAILFGAEASVLVLTSVLTVQALVFGDGGMISLGANIVTMGIITAYSSQYIYRKMNNKIGIGLASWASVVSASGVSGLLLWMSGAPFAVVPTMLSIHALIGIGEAAITYGMVSFFKEASTKRLAYGILGTVMIMAVALPFASNSPDGLETVTLGFYDNAVHYNVAMPDYSLGIVSGLIGMGIVYVITLVGGTALRKTKKIEA